MCICMYVCMYACRIQALHSACETDEADFVDWKSFLPSNPLKICKS